MTGRNRSCQHSYHHCNHRSLLSSPSPPCLPHREPHQAQGQCLSSLVAHPHHVCQVCHHVCHLVCHGINATNDIIITCSKMVLPYFDGQKGPSKSRRIALEKDPHLCGTQFKNICVLQIRLKMTSFYLLHLPATQRVLFLPFPLFYATSAKNEIGLVLLSGIISLLQAASVPLF